MVFWFIAGIFIACLTMMFVLFIMYNKKSRIRMFDTINSYLLAYKLHTPVYLKSHKIVYSIVDGNYNVTSLKPFLLENIKTSTGNYYVGIEIEYEGIRISLVDKFVAGNVSNNDSYLSIYINDNEMKNIMTDEFKKEVQRIFHKPVYTSNDFKSSDMDYQTNVSYSYSKLAKNFIKINLAVEKLLKDKY